MTKNNSIKISLFLLAFTLITTSFVARTFANYSTQASGESSARVAYWGFTAKDGSINLTDLFKKSYLNNSGEKIVESTNNVIAPGTSGSASFSFPYAGNKSAPEVAYDFVVSLDGSTIDESLSSNPNILWSLNSQYDEDFSTWDNLMNSIIRLSGDKESTYSIEQPYSVKRYKPGQIPAAFGKDNEHTIYWRWKSTNSETDNSLGNSPTSANVNLKITISATQVD